MSNYTEAETMLSHLTAEQRAQAMLLYHLVREGMVEAVRCGTLDEFLLQNLADAELVLVSTYCRKSTSTDWSPVILMVEGWQ